MFVPPLRPINNIEPFISGEVTIHPTAIIATGVILQAAPNSKIIIGPGVCIGMGSILQVDKGILEVEAGANLGAGFLMVGQGKIGANACIGSSTTILRCSVDMGQVVPPGTILGDTSRRWDKQLADTNGYQASDVSPSTESLQESPESLVTESLQESPESLVTESLQESTESETEDGEEPQPQPTTNSLITNAETSAAKQPPHESTNNFGNHIYGKGNVKRLLSTLFPHNQTLRQPLNDGQSE